MSARHCRSALLAALALTASAGRVAAQSAERPQLVISMTGGFLTGGTLWTLDRQPVLVPSSGAIDSVSLQRLFRTGFVAGVGATLYRSPHFGYTGEVSFLGLPTESRCAPLAAYAYDPSNLNEQTCLSAQGRGLSTSTATFQAGVTWRARPSAALQPYVRGMAGIAVLGGSFVTSEGFAVSDTTPPPIILARSLLEDRNPRSLTWVATIAAGASLRVNESSRFRFEIRDMVISLPVTTGPSAATAGVPYAQVGSRTIHLPTFAVSFDLLMERERRRRY